MIDTPTHGIHAPGRVLSYDPAVEVVISRETLTLLMWAARCGVDALDWAERLSLTRYEPRKAVLTAIARAEGLMEAGE